MVIEKSHTLSSGGNKGTVITRIGECENSVTVFTLVFIEQSQNVDHDGHGILPAVEATEVAAIGTGAEHEYSLSRVGSADLRIVTKVAATHGCRASRQDKLVDNVYVRGFSCSWVELREVYAKAKILRDLV